MLLLELDFYLAEFTLVPVLPPYLVLLDLGSHGMQDEYTVVLVPATA